MISNMFRINIIARWCCGRNRCGRHWNEWPGIKGRWIILRAKRDGQRKNYDGAQWRSAWNVRLTI